MSKVSSGSFSKLGNPASAKKRNALQLRTKRPVTTSALHPLQTENLWLIFHTAQFESVYSLKCRGPITAAYCKWPSSVLKKKSFQSRSRYQGRSENLNAQRNVFLGTRGECWCFRHLRKPVRKAVWWTEARQDTQPGSFTLWPQASSAGRRRSEALTSLTQKASPEHCPMLLLYNTRNK